MSTAELIIVISIVSITVGSALACLFVEMLGVIEDKVTYKRRITEGKTDPFLIKFNDLTDAINNLKNEYWDLENQYDDMIEELQKKILYLSDDKLQSLREDTINCENKMKTIRPQCEQLEKEKHELIEQNQKKFIYYFGR